MATIVRRKSVTCTIGKVRVGSDAPVVVQSMTNTDTADVASTVEQVASLADVADEIKRTPENPLRRVETADDLNERDIRAR